MPTALLRLLLLLLLLLRVCRTTLLRHRPPGPPRPPSSAVHTRVARPLDARQPMSSRAGFLPLH
jgi:hypothetical protein